MAMTTWRVPQPNQQRPASPFLLVCCFLERQKQHSNSVHPSPLTMHPAGAISASLPVTRCGPCEDFLQEGAGWEEARKKKKHLLQIENKKIILGLGGILLQEFPIAYTCHSTTPLASLNPICGFLHHKASRGDSYILVLSISK